MKERVRIGIKFFTVFAFLILFSFSFKATALNDGVFEYELVGGQCVITDCNAYVEGELTVPDTLNGNIVTAIGDNAFEGLNKISNVYLPETVKTIGENAFFGCSNLVDFVMPDSVVSLGGSAFYKCNNLKSITVSDNVTNIPQECFYECEKLENISFGDEVTTIGSKAFYGCVSLKGFVFPEKLALISKSCFERCSSLGSVYLPDGSINIGTDAFYGCNTLTYVYFAGNRASLENLAVSSGNEALTDAAWSFEHSHKEHSEVVTVQATCTNEGYESYDCICGFYGKENFQVAKGHDFSRFITQRQPDCKNKGKAKVVCSRCEEYEIIELSMTAHKIVLDDAIPATCFSSGKTEGSHCYVCSDVIVEQKTVEALGHDYSKKVIDNEHLVSPATYSKPATYRYSCVRCSAVGNKFFYADKLVLGKTSKAVSSSTANSITLKWNKVAGATGYGIYYKNAQGKWKLCAKTESNTYSFNSLQSGKKFSFAIRAYVVENGVTVASAYYETLVEATRPVKPNKVVTKQNETAVKLSWSASQGASGYRIYGYNSGAKKWVVVISSTKECSCIVSGLRSGVYYKFAVRPYIDTGSKIVWGASYAEIITATKPKAPVLKSTALKGSVRFSWEKVNGADGYIIYGSKNANSGYKRLCVTKNLTYSKSGLTSGQTYYFKAYSVKKLNGSYIYSYAGQVKAVKIK